MNLISISSLGEAHLAPSQWGQGESLRRLIQMSFRNGCRYIAVLSGPKSAQWDEEAATLFGDISHQLQTMELELLLFLVDPVKDEAELMQAMGSGAVKGYAILRPRPLGSVVEAFVVPPAPSDTNYITCQSNVTFQLPTQTSMSLSLRGLPFMQQDGAVSRCADASLWIATKLVSQAHPEWPDCKVLSHTEVAEALQYFPAINTRRLPSGGLSDMEMMLALERSGYVPIPYDFSTDATKAKADPTVYRWIESGIPVILCLALEKEAHSVVVCGHTFDPDAWWPGARTDYYPSLASEDRWLCSSLWATEYLILDDNYGPNLAMTRGSLRTRAYKAIVPLPRSAKVHLAPEDAEMIAAHVIFQSEQFLQTIPQGTTSPWLAHLLEAVRDNDKRFVLRTHLVKKSDFVGSIETAYGDSFATIVRTLTLPDFVWLVEISLPQIYGDKLKVGEIVLDPTVPWNLYKKLAPYLWINLCGQAWGSGMSAPTYLGFSEPAALLSRPG